jgi:nucleotide-binding universal stress UspA family protein
VVEDRAVEFDPPITGGVVAGVDDAAGRRAVLDWAIAEARVHDRPLHVVRAWTLAEAAHEVAAPFGIVPSLAECGAAVRAELERDVEAALGAAEPGTPTGPQLQVHLHTPHAAPGDALVAASTRADLLVLAHHGRGLLQLVLGSVTEHVLARARCPVVVLRLP